MIMDDNGTNLHDINLRLYLDVSEKPTLRSIGQHRD